ncbi:MAG: hypothetical protein ACI8VI_001191, partial [Granulosicoccus sp.]
MILKAQSLCLKDRIMKITQLIKPLLIGSCLLTMGVQMAIADEQA